MREPEADLYRHHGNLAKIINRVNATECYEKAEN